LENNEVHVWRAALESPTVNVQRLKNVLSEDERDRAERFYFPKDRDHFTVARGVLRVLLARYLDTDPNQLRFSYGSHGKPTLTIASGGDALRFNVSHSSGLALYAFARGREIGIDLERIRMDLDYEQIAARFFSARESTSLAALSTRMKPEAFFARWTLKEAYVKASGKGLSIPLDHFGVSSTPGASAALLSIAVDPDEALRWSLRRLAPALGYVAAIAVEGRSWQLRCWQWRT